MGYFEQQNYVSAAAGFELHESTSANWTEVKEFPLWPLGSLIRPQVSVYN